MGTREESNQGGMNRRRTPFSQIPAVVWSGAMAFFLSTSLGAIWTVLIIINAAVSPAIPWAVAVMALLLWVMWQYMGGRWGPRSTSQARRRYMRARRSEEHTSELQSIAYLVCRLLLEK